MPEQAPTDILNDIVETVVRFLPNLLVAAVLVLVGYVAARLLKVLAARLMRVGSSALATSLGRIFRSRELESRLRRSADRPVAEAVGRVVFWLVFLVFLGMATASLGLPFISAWLAEAALYLPRVLAAGVLLLLGVLAGNVVRNAVSSTAASAGVAYPEVLARVSQMAIVFITVVVASDQLGLELRFLIVVAAIILGAALSGAALAFGLGAQIAVRNIVSSHYLEKIYRVGHAVRIDDVEGRILEITSTSVIVGTPEGRVVVPAKDFTEKVSTLLTT